MKVIKICEECYTHSILLIEKGDVIAITNVEECDNQKHKDVEE